MPQTPTSTDRIKRELKQDFCSLLNRLFEQAERGDTRPRQQELLLWQELIPLGAKLLGYLFATLCRCAAERALAMQNLRVDGQSVQWRLDRDYWGEIRTTFGTILFPWFSVRRQCAGAWVTQTPARAVFPSQRHCRSSELCLEWETRVGIDHPFRKAQQELTFYTHEAVKLEDTTISDHMVKVSALIERTDLYRTKEQIKEILRDRATRDRQTGKPILYMSSDAHALRRYVDDTWQCEWKMANGIRLWCEDKDTGKTIHLGGEYTWGDCEAVRDAFVALIAAGVIARDGDYGDGVVAQLSWLSDGMPWFENYLLPLFADIKVILDAYHVLERLAAFFALFYGQGSEQAKAAYAPLAERITGHRGHKTRSKPSRRKGHCKRAAKSKPAHAHQRADDSPQGPWGLWLLKEVLEYTPSTKAHKAAHTRLLNYLNRNAYRMCYPTYLQAGYQIGSGAMESLHRTASQSRLKLAGARWLEETSQAIFNFRMLRLVGNWDAFWGCPSFSDALAVALVNKADAQKKAANDNTSSQAVHPFKKVA